MTIMNKNTKKNKAQAILEYLAVLSMVVLGLTFGTIFFKHGVKGGIDNVKDHLENALTKTVDDTYQGEVITYDVTYSPGGQN